MTHAYGTWPSPITAQTLTEGTVGLGDPVFDGDDLYWAQADPTDGGRVTLRRLHGGVETAITPAPHNVRSRVHEYGGGAFAVASGQVVFSDFADNRLYLINPEEPTPRPLTDDSDLRYGALQLYPEQDLIIAVREDHRGLGSPTDGQPIEPINTVVARRISDSAETPDRLLCAGADFYAGPRLGPDGRLAWVEWRHPNMPWDSTQLRAARLLLDEHGRIILGPRDAAPLVGSVVAAEAVAGGPGESVAVPTWGRDGELIFVSDRTDWWNLYRWSPDDHQLTALCPTEAEFAPPQWVLGGRPYVIMDDGRIACTINRGNRIELGLLDGGRLTVLPTDAVDIGSLSCNGSRLAAHLSYPDRPAELAVIDLGIDGPGRPKITTLRRSSSTTFPAGIVSVATEVSWSSALGTVYGWYYPPANSDVTVPGDELPPMITISHGGPTSGSSPVYRLGIQFWTSRGVAVLDVNYGGSTGYGRRYRERLHREWGEIDVIDCANGARAMAEQGRADPARLAIQGSSAGGYTTLRALTRTADEDGTDVFTAGISHFGIGDLTALVADTHKFESRYPELLIGVWPDESDVYADRSPINHVDRLRAPILLTQGTDDKVVPSNQAETFADAARTKGLPVALIMYDGEGHGFRRAENIINSQQAALTFLGRVFDFTPADDLPDLKIENLD